MRIATATRVTAAQVTMKMQRQSGLEVVTGGVGKPVGGIGADEACVNIWKKQHVRKNAATGGTSP